MGPDLSIVVPAYNEEARLEPTLREIVEYARTQRRRFEVLVVDDGSSDGTAALVRRVAAACPEVRFIRMPANRGKGYAVRAGVLNAAGRTVLFADADGATPIEELERLEAALARGAAIAIGSRNVQGAAVAVQARLHRRLIGRAFHLLVRNLTVKGFADTQCGFKLFRGDVAQDLFTRMRMNGFSFDVEVLLMAERCGYPVAEVAVNWTHKPGSRVNLVTDSLRMARDLFIIRSNAVRGWYDQPHVARLYSEQRGETREAAPVAAAP